MATTLTPVDHDPFASGRSGGSFAPVDFDPFDAELPAKRRAFREDFNRRNQNSEVPAVFEYPPELGPREHTPGLDDDALRSRGLRETLEDASRGVGDALVQMPGAFSRRGSQAAGAAAGLALLPPAAVLDAVGGGTENVDAAGGFVQSLFDNAQRGTPEANAGFGTQVGEALGALAFDMPTMMMTGGVSQAAPLAAAAPTLWRGVGAAVADSAAMSLVPGVTSGSQTAIDVLGAGGDAAQAFRAGAAEAGSAAITNVLPLNAAGGILSRALQGAGSNVVADAAAAEMVNPFLPDSIKRDPYDPQQAAISAIVGAPMGAAFGDRAADAPRMSPEESKAKVDATQARAQERAGAANPADEFLKPGATLGEFAEAVAKMREGLAAKPRRSKAEQQQLDALNMFKDNPAGLADALGVRLAEDVTPGPAPAAPGIAGLLPAPGPTIVRPDGAAVAPAQSDELAALGITPDVEKIIAAQARRAESAPVAAVPATETTNAKEKVNGLPEGQVAAAQVAAAQGQADAGEAGQAGPLTPQAPRMTAVQRDERIADLIGRRDQLDDAGRAELLDHLSEDRDQARVMGSGVPMEGVRKYAVLQRETDAGRGPKVRAFVDGDNFHDWNKRVGHAGGDEIIKFMGETLASAFPGAAFHKGGDEFVIGGQTEAELAAGMERAQAIIAEKKFVAIDADGNEQAHNGVGISFGIGTTTHAAEQQQYLAKQSRAAAGLRTERGAAAADNVGAVGTQPGGAGLQAGPIRDPSSGSDADPVALTPENEAARQDLALFKTATRSRGTISIPIPQGSDADAVRKALKRAGVRGVMPAKGGVVKLQHNQTDIFDQWIKAQEQGNGQRAAEPAVAAVAGPSGGTGGVGDGGSGAVQGQPGGGGAAQPGAARPVVRTFNDKVFNPAIHDVIDFIALRGGLNRESIESEGFDPADWNSRAAQAKNMVFLGRPLFRKGKGMTADGLREALQEHGFLAADPPNAPPRVGSSDALDLLDRALRGRDEGRRIISMLGADAVSDAMMDRRAQQDADDYERFMNALPPGIRELFEGDPELLDEAWHWASVNLDNLGPPHREGAGPEEGDVRALEEEARTLEEWLEAMRDAGLDADTAAHLANESTKAWTVEERIKVVGEIAAAIRESSRENQQAASPAGESRGDREARLQPAAEPEKQAEVEVDRSDQQRGEAGLSKERLTDPAPPRNAVLGGDRGWLNQALKEGAESAEDLRAFLQVRNHPEIMKSWNEFGAGGITETKATEVAMRIWALREPTSTQPAPSLRDKLGNVDAAELDAILGSEPAAKSAPRSAPAAQPQTTSAAPPPPPPDDGLSLSAQGRATLDELKNLFGPPDGVRQDVASYIGYAPEGVDPVAYRKAKPLLDALLLDAEQNGQSAPDFIRALVSKFGDNPVAKAMIRAYVRDPNKGIPDAPGSNLDLAGDRPVAGDGDGAVGSPVPDGNRGPRTGAGRGDGESSGGSQGAFGLRGGGASPAGERGNQPVDSGERPNGPARGPAGTDDDPRGGGIGDGRAPPEPAGAKPASQGAGERVPDGVRREQQRAASALPVKRGDLSNIRETLPYLLPGQQEDVHKAESRFAKPDGYGMLFTNGTGTGKTFTGLGVVKRFAMEGRNNIIIVAPNDKIIEDWQRSGEALGLTITRLADTKSAGAGIVITTYAGFGQNDSIARRDWDLVVADEAHYLSQQKEGAETLALRALRAITAHPRGAVDRADMLNRELADRVSELSRIRYLTPSESAERNDKFARLREARKAVEADVAARQGAARTRAVFLSATPFAYEKAVDWADGYLFSYGEDPRQRSGAYNTPSAQAAFMIQHFGYRMRYGKLTEPDAKVDRGLMQRQFNAWLKREGSLSGRTLDVAFDYDRRFQLVESAIGRRIDEALDWLREKSHQSGATDRGMSALYHAISEAFDYHSRQYLLEAIKASEAIPHIRAHLALGRKVVVFHDFKKGGGMNPFKRAVDAVTGDRSSLDASDNELRSQAHSSATAGELETAARVFADQFPDLLDSSIGQLPSPIMAMSAAFPGLLQFNGDIPPKQRRANVAKFNSDESGPQVILVQSAAGKEGISLHDTTGKHQRALLNLGLPTQPTTAIQQEGRVFRTGQASHAILRYFNTGTNWERWAFATTIATRASTAENLAAGESSRALKDGFISAFEESGNFPAGHEGEGTGGKERDRLANAALTEWDRAKAFYFGQQKKTSKTKAAEGEDYFATPEPVGLKMVQWLDLRPEEKALEPSGGHGAIARWLPENTYRTAIEPSSELRSRMAMVFDGKIVDGTFEGLHVVNKFDGIVMNPPFGTAGRTAIDHLAKAATHLNDGGRIVALIPTGPAADAKFDKWFYEEREVSRPIFRHPVHGPIYKGDTIVMRMSRGVVTRLLGDGRGANAMIEAQERGYQAPTAHLISAIDAVEPGPRESNRRVADGLFIVADIKLPSVTFERAGAKVMTRIVVIEKPENGADSPNEITRDYSSIEKIDELFDRLQDLDLKPRAKPADDAGRAEQRAEAGAKASGPVTLEEMEALARIARGNALTSMTDAGRMFVDGNPAGAADMVERSKRVTEDPAFQDASIGIVERLRAQAVDRMGAVAGSPMPGASAAQVKAVGQFKHTRTGADVFVAKINGRVERDEYDRIAAAAKAGGGYYSSFKGGGAIPGFHFKTSLERDTFLAAVNGTAPPQGEVREDRASYGKTVPVPGDSGNMVADRGRRSSSRAGAVPDSLALFTATGAPAFAARKFAADLKAHNVLVSTGTYATGIQQINSWLDAAHVIAPLRKSPQEQMMAVVSDGRGKLLAVVRHTIGLRASANVDPGTLFGAIAQVPGAKQVWLAHNHPAGDPSQSDADKALTRRFVELSSGSGITTHGMIVVAPGNRDASFVSATPAVFQGGADRDASAAIPAANRSGSVDVMERVTRKVLARGSLASVLSPDDAKRLAAGAGVSGGLLLLDARHNHVGSVPMELADMANLKTGDARTGAAALASIITEANAHAVVAVSPTADRSTVDAVANLAAFLRAGDWRLLDHIAGGVSQEEIQKGTPFKPDFSSKSGAAAASVRGMSVDAVQAIASDFTSKIGDALGVRVVVLPSLAVFGTEWGLTRGAYHAESETIYLAADMLETAADVLETLRHEMIGHYGLDALGPDGKAEILRMIVDSRETPGLRDLWAKVNRLYGDRPELERAEEVFAHAAQAERGTLGQAWDKILSALARLLRKVGLIRGMVTMPELRRIAARIAGGLRDGERAAAQYLRSAGLRASTEASPNFEGQPMFSRVDLLGEAPTDQQQAIAKARERIDAKLRGDGRGYVAPSEGPGDLFGGPRAEQAEMFGPARDLFGNPLRPDPQEGFKFSRMPPGWDAEQQAAARKTSTFAARTPIAQRWQLIRQGIGERLTQRIFDQFRALHRLSPEAFMQAHLSRGTDGTIEAVFTEGPPRWDQGAFNVDAGHGGFQKVLSDLDGEHDQFLLWVAGNRAEMLLAQGREHLFDATDIAALKRMNQGTMPDGRSRALAYAQAHMGLKRYMKAHLDIAEAAGLIDGQSRHLWEHDFYVPFYRVLEDDTSVSPGHAGGLLRQRAFQRLKGGQEPLGDLLANTLANWSHLLTASMKNAAAQKAMDAAVATGVATLLQGPQKGSVWIMRNGVQEHYQVHDPLALEAMQAISFTGFRNSLMDAMGTAKRVLTMGVTISPSFRIRSTARDTLSALATADVGYNPVANIVNGWAAMGKGSATRAAMIAGGGSVRFGAFNDGDQAQHAKRMVSMGIQNRQILDTSDKIKNALRWVWDQWQEVGDRVESINRSVIYQRAIAEGKTHLEASFAARDLMNFTSMGSSTAIRALAQILPFFNARLQGMYRLGRGAKADPRRFVAVTGALAMVSAMLFLMNQDDEEYQALPDYVRDGYWPIKLGGKWFYVPKPFEVGALATVVERGTEMATAGTDYQAKDFASTVGSVLVNQLAMNPVPQLFKPIGEAWANYDAFRQAPIDSPWEDGSDGNKFDATTSAGAIVAGQALDVSPRKIEHLVRGYFGWLGTQAMNASDWMLRDAMDLPSNPRRDLSSPGNLFVVGDFVKDARDVPSKYVQRFYDMQEQIDRVYADVKRARQVGDDAEVERLQATPEMQARGRYGSARTRMQGISRQIRQVSADKELTAAEKNEQIRELQKQRNEIARQVDRDTRAGM